MNRHLYLLLSFIFSLWLAACTPATPPPTSTPAPTIHTEAETTATPPPTLATTATEQAEAPLTPTSTPLPTVTPTVIPPATETAIPSPTPTTTTSQVALPPPTGYFYFFWDSKVVSYSGDGHPEQSLYLARPGESTTDWDIKPILNELLIGNPQIAFSPDRKKLILAIIEDTNGDGHASQESVNRGFDGYNLYTYELAANTLERLTPEILNPFDIYWLSDNETIIFRGSQDIFTYSISQSLSHKLISSPLSHLEWMVLSPNKQIVTAKLQSGQIIFVDVVTGEIIFQTGEIDRLTWSPDSSSLAVTESTTNSFLLMDAITFETTPVEGLNLIHFPTWSPDSQQIAFTQNSDDGTNLFLLSLENLTYRQLISVPGMINNLMWSPDGSQVVMSIWQEGMVSLNVIDINTERLQELWQSTDTKRLYIPAWSPDSEWLLFFAGQAEFRHREDQAGIYLIHKSGGEVYLIWDTSGTPDPYSFFWLSVAESQ